MLCTAAWAPWAVIAPAYRAPSCGRGGHSSQYTLRADVGGQLWLLGYDLERSWARPARRSPDALLGGTAADGSRLEHLFHLLDLETGLPIVTRDRFPGQGLLATSLMHPGTRWADRYVIDVPRTAYAPAEVLLELGCTT